MGRGGTRRARRLATREALRAAVWRVSRRWVDATDQTPSLRARLLRRVRPLVSWYRTRRRGRHGHAYRVVIDVTLDQAALRARLARIGAPLHPPGVAVVLRCGGGAPVGTPPDVSPWLRAAGVRVVEPGSASVRFEATCRWSPAVEIGAPKAPGIGAASAVRVRVRVAGALRVAGKTRALLWRGAETAVGVGAGETLARRDGVARALRALGQALKHALPARLPRGVGRGLWLRLRGGAPLGVQLAFGRRVARALPSVWQVAPARVRRGETWFRLVATSGARAVGRDLGGLAPPTGWRLKVATPGSGATSPDVVDVELSIAEETP